MEYLLVERIGMRTSRTYLGDSVYVNFDGFHVILATNNGMLDPNVIYLDPSVCKQLLDYVNRLHSNGDNNED